MGQYKYMKGFYMSDVLLIEGCNFIDYPIGGQLSFSRQMMKVFGNRLALVGISTDTTPTGKWIKKEIDGIVYDYYAFLRRDITSKRPVVPARLFGYWNLRKHRQTIMSLGIRNMFLQSHELLCVVLSWESESICYRFPGVDNPLSISRYQWAKPLAILFDKWFLPKVAKANVILATADEDAIQELLLRSKGLLRRKHLKQFSTRVDTTLFKAGNKKEMRSRLKLPQECKILVTTGRIHWAKGWRFLIDSFVEFQKLYSNSILYFVGDGEDRPAVEQEIEAKMLVGKVFITGVQPPQIVAEYLRASDLFVMASEKEGWSTSLIEAMASCLPIVSTDVSSANTIIQNGLNGFVIRSRDFNQFAKKMEMAIQLDPDKIVQYSQREITKYSLENLATDLGRIWEPLKYPKF